MEIYLVGLSHRTAPIELREKLSFPSEEIVKATRELKDLPGIRESLLLSTCNRTEILLAGDADAAAGHQVAAYLSRSRGVQEQEVHAILYRHRGTEAVRHLFRVAGSLDSMVVGEPQVLGQVKEAYHLAAESGSCGPLLNRLLHRTFQVAKRIRSETKIAENAVSVSYAGVELARRIFGNLSNNHALLVGAGEMAELAAQHLVSSGIARMSIANRTAERAADLASRFGGYAVGWDAVDEELAKTDIVISSAAAPHFLFRKDRLETTMRERKYRPLFFVDLGVPRNVEPTVGEIEGCYVYDLDDLEAVVEENRKARLAEAEKAERIVEEETMEFFTFLNSLNVVPTIVAIQNRAEEFRKAELAKALGDFSTLSKADQERLDYLTRALVKKILHSPITALKEAERSGEGEDVASTARKLFGVESESTPSGLSAVKKEK
ncbi:MAG: glutamyl-tRNA reductase [Bdellovibrionota bacterium]